MKSNNWVATEVWGKHYKDCNPDQKYLVDVVKVDRWGHLDLSNLVISDSLGTGMDWRGAKLDHVNFSKSIMVGTIFRGASLRKSIFDGANICNCDFIASWLLGASFVESNAEDADFESAHIGGIDFTRANLTCVDFNCVDTSVRLPNFTSSNLTGTFLPLIELHPIRLKNAILDDGFVADGNAFYVISNIGKGIDSIMTITSCEGGKWFIRCGRFLGGKDEFLVNLNNMHNAQALKFRELIECLCRE